MNKKFLIAILAGTTLSACTSLQVKRISTTDASTRKGMPYNLALSQFELRMTYELVACGVKPEISMAASVEKPVAVPDPEHRYVVDPNSLASAFKTSAVKLEYHPNGLVKSLNASAEDRTGEVIGLVGSAAVKVAKIAAGNIGSAGNRDPENCNADALEALNAAKALKPKLKAATVLTKGKEKALKALREKITALGANVDDRTEQQLSTAYDELVAAVAAQKSVMEEIEEEKAKITFVRVENWPTKSADRATKFTLPLSVVQRWVLNPDGDAGVERERTFYTSLSPIAVQGDGDASIADDSISGIPFRQAELGYLRICRLDRCGTGESEQIFEHRTLIHQLGMVYYLDCVSRPFTSVGCAFEMLDDGRLKTIGTENKKAMAEGMAGSLGSLLGSASEIAAELKPDKLQKLKDKTALLKAEQEYSTALDASLPKADVQDRKTLAGLQLSTDLAKARLVLRQAEDALKAAWIDLSE